MELKTLRFFITAPPLLLLLSTVTFFHQHRRGALGSAKAFHLLLLLSCILLPLIASQPCSVNGMQNSPEYDACGSHSFSPKAGFQDVIVGDTSSNHVAQSSATYQSFESVCTNSHSFCFLSPMLAVASLEHELKSAALGSTNLSRSWRNRNWSSDNGMFELRNGRRLSCSLNNGEGVPFASSTQIGSADQDYISSCRIPLLATKKDSGVRLSENSRETKSDAHIVSSSLGVEISPPVLDWGERFLFFPSVAFLTVANKFNNSVLHVYEPFSTDKQFYSCNHSEVSLLPGEVASICFMFLPRWLGLSSARMVLQTNMGGFLVQAKGFVVKSPYGIKPPLSIDVQFNPWSTKTFSLSNPLDETVNVEEVTAWISISTRNGSEQTQVACQVDSQDSREIPLLVMKDHLAVKSSNQGGFQSVVVRPHNNWEIGPHNSETIIEVDFLPNSQGKVSGAFCMRLLKSTQEHVDTIMVPFEVDLDKKNAPDDPPVSVSLDPLVPYDATEMVLAISLKNNAPYVLNVLNISKAVEMKLFHIKYTEGLLLFPGTVTQVALITCSKLPAGSRDSDSPLEASDIDKGCLVLVLMNDSSRPQIEILCRDVFSICQRNQQDSPVRLEERHGNLKSVNKKTGSLANSMRSSLQLKGFEGAEPEEMILGNWKSQGSTSVLSVLKETEVVFPVVQVGTHLSKWIVVKNPSQQPVVMQLILNSGEIIDECKGQNGLLQPPSVGSSLQSESKRQKIHGFSIAENAVTEGYVHPSSELTLGPINFHPSDRCRWRSSALIRNNLSGVEWLSLRGSGGLLSFTLLEGSKPVHNLEFKPSLSIPLNISPLGSLFHMGETASICSQPLFKELDAKNTGDLPLEVRSIMVSGTECGSDGFMVHQCKGFYLEPGESTKVRVSYQTDFSFSVISRDLELALASGFHVIPMKASGSDLICNLCKKTVFWVRLKKLLLAVLLAAALIVLVFFCVLPQAMAIGSHDDFYESQKSCRLTIRSLEKSSCLQRIHKKGKFAISAEMDCLLRSIGEETFGRCPHVQDGASQVDNSVLTNNRKALASISNAEESEPANLTVRTGKDKKKRRKKRRGVAGGLTSLVEISSSQSGNSTPSSPMSPVITPTPNLTFQQSPDSDQFQDTRNPFSQAALSSKPASVSKSPETNLPVGNSWSVSPRQHIPRLMLQHSATFPTAGSRCAASSVRCSSPLAPHARAPGSRVCNQKSGEAEEKSGVGNQYVYDIWGDHLPGLHLMARMKDENGGKNSSCGEDNSDSFFVKGPQTFLANSHPRYVSFFNQ